ncbi:MAG: DUF4136 domain-containing protein [Halioglobus sp.]
MSYTFKAVNRCLTLIVMALVLAACASGPLKPAVDYKADYDFRAIKKIAFYDESGQVTGSNPLQLSDMQRDRIDEALSYALTNRGFTMVNDAKDADLLLSWSLFTQQKTDVNTWNTPTVGVGYGGYYSRYNRYSGYNCWNCMAATEVSVSNYTEGTFIVDMIDPKLHKSVWRGVIQSRMKGQHSADQDKYNAAATAIFASFPPGSEAAAPTSS